MIPNPSCLNCTVTLVSLKSVFVRYLSLLTVGFDFIFFFLYTHTSRICFIVIGICASACKMKKIVHLWSNYMFFGSLNFPLHGLASV